MSDLDPGFLDQKYLVDPYANWAEREGAPIITGRALDLFAVETKPWARFDTNGAICHVDGRCDFLSVFVLDLAPGQTSAPSRHVHDECLIALSGSGESDIALSNGAMRTISWRAGQAFAAPVNATIQHRNRGSDGARLVAFNDLRYLMGLYRNEGFLFANSGAFAARQDRAMLAGLLTTLSGEDALSSNDDAADVRHVKLADLALGLDLMVLKPGEFSRARRQMQGQHVLCLEGAGYSLSFTSQSSGLERIDWRSGVLAGLAGMSFHQHFNPGDRDLRLVTVELGSLSSPMFRSRRAAFGDTNVYASGAAEIALENQRDDISRHFAETLRNLRFQGVAFSD